MRDSLDVRAIVLFRVSIVLEKTQILNTSAPNRVCVGRRRSIRTGP